VTFVELDLSSLSSVRKAATEINSKIERLDLLVNNAGIMATRDFEKSVDGIELQFAANHVGHFLLTNLLMEKLFAAEGGRIVNVSSGGYVCSRIRFEDWNFKVRLLSIWQSFQAMGRQSRKCGTGNGVVDEIADRTARSITPG
jgi:NAD(P)-dependent dehydrogenase (short-subunit alcohol dehydrogenase family)